MQFFFFCCVTFHWFRSERQQYNHRHIHRHYSDYGACNFGLVICTNYICFLPLFNFIPLFRSPTHSSNHKFRQSRIPEEEIQQKKGTKKEKEERKRRRKERERDSRRKKGTMLTRRGTCVRGWAARCAGRWAAARSRAAREAPSATAHPSVAAAAPSSKVSPTISWSRQENRPPSPPSWPPSCQPSPPTIPA